MKKSIIIIALISLMGLMLCACGENTLDEVETIAPLTTAADPAEGWETEKISDGSSLLLPTNLSMVDVDADEAAIKEAAKNDAAANSDDSKADDNKEEAKEDETKAEETAGDAKEDKGSKSDSYAIADKDDSKIKFVGFNYKKCLDGDTVTYKSKNFEITYKHTDDNFINPVAYSSGSIWGKRVIKVNGEEAERYFMSFNDNVIICIDDTGISQDMVMTMCQRLDRAQ